MHSSNFVAASCCLLISSASFFVGNVSSFVAPESLVQRRQYQHRSFSTKICSRESNKDNGKSSAISDRQQSKKPESNNIVDDLWISQFSSSEENENNSIDIRDESLSEDSSDSTKWILVGGTVLVVVAAGALAVTMGNDLGIELNLG